MARSYAFDCSVSYTRRRPSHTSGGRHGALTSHLPHSAASSPRPATPLSWAKPKRSSGAASASASRRSAALEAAARIARRPPLACWRSLLIVPPDSPLTTKVGGPALAALCSTASPLFSSSSLTAGARLHSSSVAGASTTLPSVSAACPSACSHSNTGWLGRSRSSATWKARPSRYVGVVPKTRWSGPVRSTSGLTKSHIASEPPAASRFHRAPNTVVPRQRWRTYVPPTSEAACVSLLPTWILLATTSSLKSSRPISERYEDETSPCSGSKERVAARSSHTSHSSALLVPPPPPPRSTSRAAGGSKPRLPPLRS
mmetsp:Transcript_45867/g.147772  ORF Transcript_45867/g.147772 Transcript_45867/m.147772 type:complete len:315 (-) Transcript_45867:88-1032(-)